jgi:hypothetical protein
LELLDKKPTDVADLSTQLGLIRDNFSKLRPSKVTAWAEQAIQFLEPLKDTRTYEIRPFTPKDSWETITVRINNVLVYGRTHPGEAARYCKELSSSFSEWRKNVSTEEIEKPEVVDSKHRLSVKAAQAFNESIEHPVSTPELFKKIVEPLADWDTAPTESAAPSAAPGSEAGEEAASLISTRFGQSGITIESPPFGPTLSGSFPQEPETLTPPHADIQRQRSWEDARREARKQHGTEAFDLLTEEQQAEIIDEFYQRQQ